LHKETANLKAQILLLEAQVGQCHATSSEMSCKCTGSSIQKHQQILSLIWVFPKIGVPQNGWFIMENPIKMDDRKHPSISQRRNKGSKRVAVPACNLKLCLDQVDACDFLWQIKIQQTFWNPHYQNKDACGNY